MGQILGVLFAAIVGLASLGSYVWLQRTGNENVLKSVTAGQQKTLNAAVTKYAQTYYSNLTAAATASSPVVITVAMLQNPAVNLLDSSFTGINPYGQTWQAQVLQPSAGALQVFTFGTGGTALPDRLSSAIAGLVGDLGGVVPKNDSGAYAGGAAFAFGSFGGWKAATANYIGLVGGRTVSLLNFSNGQLVSNYLYRNAVPGQPQLNQMNTTLDMNNNDISNAKNVAATTISTTSTATIGGNSTIAGTLNVTGNISTPATARVGDVQLLNIQVEGTPCPEIGRQARASTGLPLSCKDGLWQSSTKYFCTCPASDVQHWDPTHGILLIQSFINVGQRVLSSTTDVSGSSCGTWVSPGYNQSVVDTLNWGTEAMPVSKTWQCAKP